MAASDESHFPVLHDIDLDVGDRQVPHQSQAVALDPLGVVKFELGRAAMLFHDAVYVQGSWCKCRRPGERRAAEEPLRHCPAIASWCTVRVAGGVGRADSFYCAIVECRHHRTLRILLVQEQQLHLPLYQVAVFWAGACDLPGGISASNTATWIGRRRSKIKAVVLLLLVIGLSIRCEQIAVLAIAVMNKRIKIELVIGDPAWSTGNVSRALREQCFFGICIAYVFEHIVSHDPTRILT